MCWGAQHPPVAERKRTVRRSAGPHAGAESRLPGYRRHLAGSRIHRLAGQRAGSPDRARPGQHRDRAAPLCRLRGPGLAAPRLAPGRGEQIPASDPRHRDVLDGSRCARPPRPRVGRPIDWNGLGLFRLRKLNPGCAGGDPRRRRTHQIAGWPRRCQPYSSTLRKAAPHRHRRQAAGERGFHRPCGRSVHPGLRQR